jgi:multiple antibiotic resistance protein
VDWVELIAASGFLQAFFSLFVVMDILGSVPVFWHLSSKLNRREKQKSVNKAILIAGGLLLVFLFLGERILLFFGVSIASFRVAGGILLFIIGIRMVMGMRLMEARVEKYEFAAVPLATPLITGPGVITTIILLVHTYGLFIAFLSASINILLAWIILRHSHLMHAFLGRQGADVVGRIMGLIIASLAVEFIKTGWVNIL